MAPSADQVADSASSGPRPCQTEDGTRCMSFHAGHNMHQIHARKVGQRPWGWRDGVIAALGPDGGLEVNYLGGGRLMAWHHEDLRHLLAIGSPVRVHEEYYALGSPLGWLSLLISSGLGDIPNPADADSWLPETSAGIRDIATGRGLATDHPGEYV